MDGAVSPNNQLSHIHVHVILLFTFLGSVVLEGERLVTSGAAHTPKLKLELKTKG